MLQGTIRAIRPDEYVALFSFLSNVYGRFHSPHETRRQLSSRHFDPSGCFVAEHQGSIIGCVAVTGLPREKWFVLRYLALRDASQGTDLAKQLVQKAVDFARSHHAEYLRSTTPRLEPYVNAYKKSGFEPVRRDFRIVWTLKQPKRPAAKIVKLQQVTDKTLDLAADTFIKSLEPYWIWRTEEHGGQSMVIQSFKDGFKHDEKWMLAVENDKVVGLTGLIPDYYASGKARFRGAYVLSENRGRGIGKGIMQKALEWASTLKQEDMLIYTFSYLDRLAPGAALYLKSGGKIDCEYLQLQKSLE